MANINVTVSELYDLSETIASGLFEGAVYPWEVLPKIHDFIIGLGKTLPKDIFEEREGDIWVAKNAKVAPTACLNGPLIIDEGAQVRHCAFIRGNAIIGKEAVVGNSTELKNVVLFNKVQVPHYNYVGDSILGFKAHMGAGSITSNVKSDKTLVTVKGIMPDAVCGGAAGRDAGEATALGTADMSKSAGEATALGTKASESLLQGGMLETGLKKMGAMLGDNVEVGCNSVLNPGTVIGRNSIIYPTSMVRGVVPPNSIYKSKTEIAEKY